MDAPVSQHAGRPAALAFIYVTIMLDMVALGLVMPVLPRLVLDFSHGDTVNAAAIVGLFSSLWALMQFFSSPIMGSLADAIGRRPVVLISNFGLGLDYVLMAVAPGLALLLVGRIIAGITAASIGAGSAYIADVTPPERRASAYGILSVLFGLGFIVGPALGGLLAAGGPRVPFWVAAALSLANGIYGTFILPESLPPERRVPFRWKTANPMGALKLLRSHRELAGLSWSNFIAQVTHASLPALFVLYAQFRYGWDSWTVGVAFAIVGACSAVVGGLLVRPVVARLGDRRALLVGMLFDAVGFALMALAPNGTAFLASIPIFALGGLAQPPLQAIMTRRVAPTQQGQLQGANSSVMGVAGMLGPTLFTGVFAWFIDPTHGWNVPGAAYLLAAALMLGSTLIAWRVTRPEPLPA